MVPWMLFCMPYVVARCILLPIYNAICGVVSGEESEEERIRDYLEERHCSPDCRFMKLVHKDDEVRFFCKHRKMKQMPTESCPCFETKC